MDSLKKLCNDYGLTPEGVRHAIETYQSIICEITGDRLSKLTYDKGVILEAAEEHYEWKYGKQEPVGIEIEGGGSNWWYVCEECRGAVDSNDSYCRHCGRPFEQKKSACDGCAYKGSEDCPLKLGIGKDCYCPNGKLM